MHGRLRTTFGQEEIKRLKAFARAHPHAAQYSLAQRDELELSEVRYKTALDMLRGQLKEHVMSGMIEFLQVQKAYYCQYLTVVTPATLPSVCFRCWPFSRH